MISAIHPIPGLGTVPSVGSYAHTWTHGLGIATPQLALFQLVVASPESWRFVPPNEWDARVTLLTLTLTLASTPPAAGHVGALKLCALAPDAAPAVPAGRTGGICSSLQLGALRAKASAVLGGTFPTVIAIGDRVDIPAARWGNVRSEKSELAGLMPTSAAAFRVERVALAGLAIEEGITRLVEDGRHFRVSQVRDAKGDPGLVLECTAA